MRAIALILTAVTAYEQVISLKDFRASGLRPSLTHDQKLFQCFLVMNGNIENKDILLDVYSKVAAKVNTDMTEFAITFTWIDSTDKKGYGRMLTDFKINPDSAPKLLFMKLNMLKPSRPRLFDGPIDLLKYDPMASNKDLLATDFEEFIVDAATDLIFARGEEPVDHNEL